MNNMEPEVKAWRKEVKKLMRLKSEDVLQLLISDLQLSARLSEIFPEMSIVTVEDLTKKKLIDLAQQEGILVSCIDEVRAKLDALNLSLADSSVLPQILFYEHPASSMQAIEHGGYKLCIEFAAPIDLADIPEQYRKPLSPWFRQFMGLSSEEITALLGENWAGLKTVDAGKIRDYFLSLTPTGIASDVTGAWLVFRGEEGQPSDALFLCEPHVLKDEERLFIKEFNQPALEECCTTFHQCNERNPWENALDFWNCSHSDLDYLGDSDPTNSLSDGEDGMHIHSICSGDSLLIGKDGRIAQSLHEIVWSGRPNEGTVHVLNSFSDFIDHYIRYLKNPYDSSISPLFWGDYSQSLNLMKL